MRRCPNWIGDVQCTKDADHWEWWHTHDSRVAATRWAAQPRSGVSGHSDTPEALRGAESAGEEKR